MPCTFYRQNNSKAEKIRNRSKIWKRRNESCCDSNSLFFPPAQAFDRRMLTGWGSNRWCQLGEKGPGGSQQTHSAKLEPTLILENERLSFVSAGDGHSLFVTETGDLMGTGRGTEGQLGLGVKTTASSPQIVSHLQDEVIVGCAAGAMHSLAITAAGKVYIWGLIHVSSSKKKEEKPGPSNPSEGRDGISAEAHDSVDDESDDHKEDEVTVATAAAGGDARQMLGISGNASDKLLRIVMESTEKWMTASDAPTASRRGEGFNDEEAAEEAEAEARAAKMEAERATERGEAGDLGMMRMDMLAQRRPVMLPTMVQGALAKERVIAVSAGFGHSLALTDHGTVFSSGYNDRGQLGLGHRVNCPSFQPIIALDGRIVVQIACGSQHNLLRVLSVEDKNIGECWVFGNGALGQLGLGRKVTGRRTPAHLPILSLNNTSLNVVHVAAGANHSVCVARNNQKEGGVFSWGHGEYGQHGGKESIGSHDLVDAFYYYVPRRLLSQMVQPNEASTHHDNDVFQEEEFVAASCGNCFTLGLTNKGSVWSWGWNAHGVLGRGRGLVSHAPMKVQALGLSADREATMLAVGGNHCLALVSSSAAIRAILLRPLLNSILKKNENGEGDRIYDIILTVQGSQLRANRIILESRCNYFKGLFAVIEKEQKEEWKEKGKKNRIDDDEPTNKHSSIFEISLDSEFATTITVKSLLIYLYTDMLECPPHRVDMLRKLAVEFHLDRLVGLCLSKLGYHDLKNEKGDHGVGNNSSTFEFDMNKAVNSEKHADVIFYTSKANVRNQGLTISSSSSNNIDNDDNVIWAHRCLLTHVDYFNTLLNGKYKEGIQKNDMNNNNRMTSLKEEQLNCIKIDVSGMLDDGLKFETLLLVIQFIYTGSTAIVPLHDPNAVTELAVAAERFGVLSLVRICERSLVASVDDVENATACIEFANRFHLRRLSKHCNDILANSLSTLVDQEKQQVSHDKQIKAVMSQIKAENLSSISSN